MDHSEAAAFLKGKRVAVLGAGRSGVAAAQTLSRQGAQVLLSDSESVSANAINQLTPLKIQIESNGHSNRIFSSDLIVVSPGIAWQHPVLKRAREQQIELWSELELGFRLCPSKKIIAVTGTNGKSTVTRLIGALLAARGLSVAVGGNLGTPYCELLTDIDASTWVTLEVSSFQLETVQEFSPHIGVWLNLSPDHLDRHGSMRHYADLKARLFAHQQSFDHAILGDGLELPSTCVAQQHAILPQLLDHKDVFSHQRFNLAAALHTARLVDPGCEIDAIDWRAQLLHPHCLEPLEQAQGVRFFNDSKATNPQATIAATDALKKQGPLCVVLGGDHKGIRHPDLGQHLAQAPHIAQIVFVGIPDKVWQTTLGPAFHTVTLAKDYDHALQLLDDKIRCCILSPAAASFDRHANYQARGDAFRRAVEKLQQPAA